MQRLKNLSSNEAAWFKKVEQENRENNHLF
jgi:hypothetical protein